MNNNESPLSIKEQIEVLEAAKDMLSLELHTACDDCIGLCNTIGVIIYYKYNHLYKLLYIGGIHKVVPSFTFANAVLHGTVDKRCDPTWFWWSTKIENGGITNRLNFLDYLINKLKNEDHE